MGKAPYLVLFVMLATTLGALPTFSATQYCFDSDTLLSTTDAWNGVSWNNTTTYHPCPNGCNNNTFVCNPELYDTDNNILFFLFPFIGFVILIAGIFIDEEDWAIGTLFLTAALIFVVAGAGMFSTYVTETSLSVFNPFVSLYWFSIIILVVTLLYYLLKTGFRALFSLGKIK